LLGLGLFGLLAVLEGPNFTVGSNGPPLTGWALAKAAVGVVVTVISLTYVGYYFLSRRHWKTEDDGSSPYQPSLLERMGCGFGTYVIVLIIMASVILFWFLIEYLSQMK